MKKLILIFGIFFITLGSFSQTSENVWPVVITSGAPANTSVPITGDISIIDISGTATLSTFWSIQAATTPGYEMTLWGLYRGTVTKGIYHITFFGVKIPDQMYDDTILMKTTYAGGSWKTVMIPNFGNPAMVSGSDLDSDIVDGVTIEIDATNGLQVIDDGITLAKMAGITAGQILMGDAAGDPVTQTLTGDVFIDATGATTLQSLTVATANIVDKNVTLAKVEDVTRGSILVGGASDRPVELVGKTSAQLLIGDGTDVVSVPVTGDIDISNAGVTDIQANAVVTADITDANVTLAKIETLASGQLIVADGAGIPTARTITGDLAISATGVTTIQNGSVDNDMLSSDIQPTKATLDILASANEQNGFMAVRTINSAGFKALLDGSVNQLFDVKDGETVLKVIIAIQTVSGVAQTIDVGGDANVIASGQDVDAFVAAANSNVAGWYTSEDATYMGANAEFGYWMSDGGGDGYLLIQSSANLTATGIVGTATMYYIVKN